MTRADDVQADTVIEAVLRWADLRPDRPAVGFRGQDGWQPPLTYAELRRALFGAAHALRAAGVDPGDRVLLAVDTGRTAVAGFLGALAIGAVPVMTAPFLGGLGGGAAYLQQLARQVALVGARLLVLQPEMVPHAGELGVPLLAESALVADADAPPGPIAGTREQISTIQLTSGSTGIQRAVLVSNGNSIANAEALRDRVGAGDDVMVGWLPLFHDMGLQGALLFLLMYGNTTMLIPPAQFVRDPGVWLEGIERHRATFLVGPNFGFALTARALGKRPAAPDLFSRVRCIWNGAEPIQAESVERFLAAAAPSGLAPGAMMPCYGLGEATLVVSCTRPGDGMRIDRVDRDALARGEAAPAAPGAPELSVVSCGPVVRHMQVAIVDEEDRALGERQVGQVVCSGAAVSSGYHGDPEATRATFRDGRVFTGDLGYLAGGELHLVGRTKDVLIVRGQKYAAQTVEWAAEEVEGTRRGRSAAFSVPNPDTGTEDVVVACETGLPPDQHDELRRRIAERVLAGTGLRVTPHLVPSGVVPKTSSGKVRRGAARELYLQFARGAG